MLGHVLPGLFITCFVDPSTTSHGPQYQILTKFICSSHRKRKVCLLTPSTLRRECSCYSRLSCWIWAWAMPVFVVFSKNVCLQTAMWLWVKDLSDTITKLSIASAVEKRCRSTTEANVRAGLWSMEPSSTAKRSKDFNIKEAEEHLLQKL